MTLDLSNENSETISIRVPKVFKEQLLNKLEQNNLKVGFFTRLYWREYLEDKLNVDLPTVEVTSDESAIQRT